MARGREIVFTNVMGSFLEWIHRTPPEGHTFNELSGVVRRNG